MLNECKRVDSTKRGVVAALGNNNAHFGENGIRLWFRECIALIATLGLEENVVPGISSGTWSPGPIIVRETVDHPGKWEIDSMPDAWRVHVFEPVTRSGISWTMLRKHEDVGRAPVKYSALGETFIFLPCTHIRDGGTIVSPGRVVIPGEI
jgi:hypothetical protein